MTRTLGPNIYIVGRPTLDLAEINRFLKNKDVRWVRSPDTKDASEIVEIAGRICYMSFTDDAARITYPNSRYISNLIKKGHDSVLEHATWTFIIDGVSRAFTHQLVRHRIGFSFSQLSQQYHDESDAIFVEPVGIADYPSARQKWQTAVDAALLAYRQIVEEIGRETDTSDPETRRWLRSAARSLLPNSTQTTIAVTANARSIRHFWDMRGGILGDPEMRQVSVALFQGIGDDAPELFGDFVLAETTDGVGKIVRRTDTAEFS